MTAQTQIQRLALQVNLKTLSGVDLNPVEKENLNEIPSECVSELISHFLALEKVQEEGFVYGVLPVNTPSILPRGKPVPSRKAETRWERFAKEKGIQKVKKKRVAWNEETGEYLPTFGYKNQGKSSKDLSDWIQEVGQDQDPSTDLVAEKRKEKKDRVAKNDMQQRRNIEEGLAQAKGIDYRSMRKEELRRRLQDAKKSNASMGKFDKLQDGVKLRAGKRKFDDVTKSADKERDQSLQILSTMEKNQTKSQQVTVNARKAVHSALRNDDKKEITKKFMAPKSGKKKRKKL